MKTAEQKVRSTVSFRAAEYFGMAREPRTTIKTGRRQCVVVARRGEGMALALYDEEYGQKGMYVWLSDDQRDILVEALGSNVRRAS